SLLAELRKRTLTADDRETIRGLIGKLGSENFATRETASRQLFALGRRSLPQLQEAVKDKDAGVPPLSFGCQRDLWGRVKEFMEHRGDPVEQIGDAFGQPPRVTPQRLTQRREVLLPPQVQPPERPSHQPQQTTDAPPTPHQKRLQGEVLLDPARTVLHAPATTVRLHKPSARPTPPPRPRTDQQQQRPRTVGPTPMHYQQKLLRRDLGQTHGTASRVTTPRPGTRPTLGLHLLGHSGDGPWAAIGRTDMAVADQTGDEGQAVGHQRPKQVAAVEATVDYPGALASGGPMD